MSFVHVFDPGQRVRKWSLAPGIGAVKTSSVPCTVVCEMPWPQNNVFVVKYDDGTVGQVHGDWLIPVKQKGKP